MIGQFTILPRQVLYLDALVIYALSPYYEQLLILYHE
nr:MAG TPA: hypothetical protein [Caudoviricetes sp.]